MTNNKLKIWDTQNKQWLVPMDIIFKKDGAIGRVTAKLEGSNVLVDGFYTLEGDDLDKISIWGNLSFNTHLLPVRG